MCFPDRGSLVYLVGQINDIWERELWLFWWTSILDRLWRGVLHLISPDLPVLPSWKLSSLLFKTWSFVVRKCITVSNITWTVSGEILLQTFRPLGIPESPSQTLSVATNIYAHYWQDIWKQKDFKLKYNLVTATETFLKEVHDQYIQKQD